MVRIAAVGALVLLLCSVPGLAWGHGDLQGTDPEQGSRVKKPPATVAVTLTEAPARGSVMTVRDGCGRKVPGEVFVQEADLGYSVSDGEPGAWRATYRAISAEDGHLTQGKVTFTVAGKKDCSKEPSPADQIGGGAETRVNAPPGDEGSSFPIVPFAIGTAVVVGAAFFLRRSVSDE